VRTDPKTLHGGSCDFLVVGGGIQGAAVARELVLRGASVCLVDRADFASGTSMRSSRLVHGGLRYLKNGHLALVREALAERERLLRQMPHLVRPQAMVLPFFPDSGGSAPWLMKLGVRLYAMLARGSTLPKPQSLSAADAIAAFPGLRARELRGALQFWDAATEDLPLTLAILDDAAAHGARLCNYVEVVGVADGAVQLVDRMDGAAMEMRAGAVVNGAGPHADELRRAFGIEGEELVRTSRGSHLVLPARAGATALAAFLPDDRIQFVIPHEDGTVCGTTEVEEPATGEPSVPEDDVRYLLDALAYLMEPAPRREDVLFAYAGWRALPRARGPAGALNREAHLITEAASGMPVHTIVGGKLTTHRALAERVANELLGRGPSPTRTRAPRAGQGPHEPADPLWRRHGAAAALVRSYARDPGQDRAIGPERPFLHGEAVHALRDRGAVTFADLALRRLFHTAGPCLDDAWLRPLYSTYLEHRRWGGAEDYAAAVADLRAEVAAMTGAGVPRTSSPT